MNINKGHVTPVSFGFATDSSGIFQPAGFLNEIQSKTHTIAPKTIVDVKAVPSSLPEPLAKGSKTPNLPFEVFAKIASLLPTQHVQFLHRLNSNAGRGGTIELINRLNTGKANLKDYFPKQNDFSKIIKFLNQEGKHLRYLDCRQFTAKEALEMTLLCPNLKELDLCEIYVEDNHVSGTSAAPTFEEKAVDELVLKKINQLKESIARMEQLNTGKANLRNYFKEKDFSKVLAFLKSEGQNLLNLDCRHFTAEKALDMISLCPNFTKLDLSAAFVEEKEDELLAIDSTECSYIEGSLSDLLQSKCTNLKELVFIGNLLGTPGIEKLVNSDFCNSLTHLTLIAVSSDPESMTAALVNSKHLEKLEVLDVRYNHLSARNCRESLEKMKDPENPNFKNLHTIIFDK